MDSVIGSEIECPFACSLGKGLVSFGVEHNKLLDVDLGPSKKGAVSADVDVKP